MTKLLLVEDDNNLREIYEARLSAEGYEITTAQNGEEALSVAKEVHPDLIISDVMMPRISGFEMLDILRNTEELKNTKIIMLTALSQAEDQGRADNLGADKYLVKSQVTLEDIVKAAAELLNEDGSGTVVTPTATPSTTPAEPETATPEVVTPEPAVTSPAPEPAVAQTVVDPTATQPVATPMASSDTTATATAVPAPPVTASPAPTAAATPVEPTATTPDPTLDSTVPTTSDATVTPVVTPVEPTASATVTVTDPDPLGANSTAADEPAADSVASTPVTPASDQAPTPEAQTLEAEEAAIEQQISSFAETPDTAVPTQQPVAAPSATTPQPAEAFAVVPASSEQTNNDTVLAQAVSELTGTETTAQAASPEAEEVVPAPAPTPEVMPAPAPTPEPDTNEPMTSSQQVTGHKLIQPLDASDSSTPNIEALLAAEDAKDATNTAPQVVVADNTVPSTAEPPKPTIDPNTIAL